MFAFLTSTRARIKGSIGTGLRLAVFALLLAALICWSGSSYPAWAQTDSAQQSDPAQQSLDLIGEPLHLQLKEGEEEIPVEAVVRNNSGRDLDLKLSAVVRDSGEGEPTKVTIELGGSTSVGPYSVTAVDRNLKAAQLEDLVLPLKGILVVAGTEKGGSVAPQIAPGTLPITVSKVDPRGALLPAEINVPRVGLVDMRNVLLFVPFVVSLGVIMSACIWFYFGPSDNWSRTDRRKLAPLIGKRSAFGTGLSFDPGKSWAALLTGVAALLTSFTALQVLPATFTQTEVAVLALSFGGILIVAPAVYNGLRWRKPFVPKKEPQDGKQAPEQPQAPKIDKELELSGYASTLLVSSAGILGALLGQLILVFLLIHEIENAHVTDTGRRVLWILTGAVMVYASVYVVRGTVSCLQEQAAWRERLEHRRKELERQLNDAKQRIDELNRQIRALRERETELVGRVPRTDKVDEELRELRDEMSAKSKEVGAKRQDETRLEEEIGEIDEELDLGTPRRQLRTF